MAFCRRLLYKAAVSRLGAAILFLEDSFSVCSSSFETCLKGPEGACFSQSLGVKASAIALFLCHSFYCAHRASGDFVV